MKVNMTRSQALKLGLLVCKCGHRPNNHFEHGKHPCAFCTDCKVYREYIGLPASDTKREHWFQRGKGRAS